MNTLQVFNYQNNPVSFKDEDGQAYINATEMAKPFGKRPAKWLELPSTKELIAAIGIRPIRKSDTYVETINGIRNEPKGKSRTLVITMNGVGTWLHEDIALDFAQAVSGSTKSCLVGEMATILKQNGVRIGQNRLFAWLRANGFLCSIGERYNLPTQKSMDMSLFEIKKTSIIKPDGTVLVTNTPKITGKGQIYFLNKIKEFY